MIKWYSQDGLVTRLTAATFQKFIETHDRVFIHFAAIWNGYDRMLVPHVAGAAADFQNKIYFAAVDIDMKENFDLCVAHRVSNAPFIAIYKDGKLEETGVGYDFAIQKLTAFRTKKTH
jgi:thiol-disulfide isomerase/thioredoxin